MSDKTMGRPTDEKKDRRVTIRISEDLYERLYKGNISEDIREVLEGSFVGQNNESFVGQNMYEEELTRLSERLGINEYKLLEVVDYLISSGKLYRSETGKLKMKGLNADAEYISVDEAIDNLDAPEWKKKSFKETILKNLDVNRFDDTGNGGGL